MVKFVAMSIALLFLSCRGGQVSKAVKYIDNIKLNKIGQITENTTGYSFPKRLVGNIDATDMTIKDQYEHMISLWQKGELEFTDNLEFANYLEELSKKIKVVWLKDKLKNTVSQIHYNRELFSFRYNKPTTDIVYNNPNKFMLENLNRIRLEEPNIRKAAFFNSVVKNKDDFKLVKSSRNLYVYKFQNEKLIYRKHRYLKEIEYRTSDANNFKIKENAFRSNQNKCNLFEEICIIPSEGKALYKIKCKDIMITFSTNLKVKITSKRKSGKEDSFEFPDELNKILSNDIFTSKKSKLNTSSTIDGICFSKDKISINYKHGEYDLSFNVGSQTEYSLATKNHTFTVK